ncbi:AraC family transcriptional regulator [Burkholderia ubonensis]|uniref:AraC family transcriptional regulator n=1 Tax=Burkholderia ubonensis TaxID=101571 RepID=UPI000BA54A49|nr:AraC family transcriptional regulator [Burkholderia ubonensis]PAJ85326.1 AraC family transcriptional regulator [Burkholderia ubonensis]PAJ92272.1 AraC family transcriptional regulator [Burkholderia ubonensis]PAK05628.1 AraC family transcriptional regulator [Burkholderia ubonensis]RQP67691.1 AraC family transcriptional regulator [Burkholderia ubonensis]RQP84771.1 AraC family transcriptional regulator [Burkholderia ubonensis]
MDPLSDVLSLLRMTKYHSATLSAGGHWALRFHEHDGIKFSAVVRGSHWLIVNGAKPIHLHEGDCFLLTRGQAFIVSSDAAPDEPQDPDAFVLCATEDELAWRCGGDEVLLVGARFSFVGAPANALVSILPPIVHVEKRAPEAAVLHYALERFTAELQGRRPGGARVMEHLANLMFVEVMRIHLDAMQDNGVGWFYALSDEKLAPVIGAIHDSPARNWSVDELADLVRMSRSAFASRFKAIVGTPPMDYLMRWRMLIAADKLLNTDDHIALIAFAVGYQSESAFSTAFKRVMKVPPRQYQRGVCPPVNFPFE